MAIRYDKKILNEISRITKNYNAKISRLEKSLTYDNVIPERVSIPRIKSRFQNRTDLKRYLSEMQEFTKRGAEKPISQTNNIPKYLYNQIKRKQRRASYNLNRQIRLYEREHVTLEGKKQRETIATHDYLEYQNLLSKMENLLNTDLSTLSENELLKLNEKLTTVTKTGRNKQFQNNFLDILMKDAKAYGQDSRRIEEIQNKLKRLSSSQFYHLSITEDTIKQILAYYKMIGDKNFEDLQTLNQDNIDSLFNSLYENINQILDNYNV